MDRPTFEEVRDLEGKRIEQDVRFSRPKATAPVLVAEGISIVNGLGLDVRMTIHHNTEAGGKTINVYIPGVGPICRLDVDGPAHAPAGRNHKHAIQCERCPDRNLPDGVIRNPSVRREVQSPTSRTCSTFAIALETTLSD